MTPETPGSDQAKRPYQGDDGRVARVMFWCTLALLVALVGGAHLLQWSYSYDLNRVDPATGAVRPGRIRHGSYGFYLARLRPEPRRAQPVFLLSNSAYRSSGVVERMQTMARAEGQPIEFFNLAQAGAGIHDHLVQLAEVIHLHPRLVVVAFINLAFTTDHLRRDSLPRFRTDCDQMAFGPNPISVLPLSFYTRHFGLQQAASSALASLFPYKRLDTIIRWQLGRLIKRRGWLPRWALAVFSFPTLNLASNWQRRRFVPRLPSKRPRPYPETARLLREMIAMAKAHHQPILFIRQESGPSYDHPDIMDQLRQAAAAYPLAFVRDLKKYFKPAELPDHVHPRGPAARQAYARRHYKVITETLAKLP